MKRIQSFAALGVLALLAAVAAPVHAQPAAGAGDAGKMKTMAVVSISSYDELVHDLDYLGEQVGRPGLSQMLEGGIAAFTQGRGTVGLDPARPWGVVVRTDGMQIAPLGFLPVKDLQAIITTIAEVTNTKPKKTDGVYELQAGNQTLYVAEKNQWAYIAQNADALKNVPANPAKLLDGLNERYDFAVRLYVQNVPAMFRNLAVQSLKQGVQQGLQPLPDEDDEAFQARKKIVEAQLAQMTMLVEETDTVTIGWSVEPKEHVTFLDFAMTAKPNSKFAKQFATMKQAKTDFAGFLDSDAAIRLLFVSQTTNQADIAQSVAMLDALAERAKKQIDQDTDLPNDEARQKVKSAIDDVMSVVKQTVKEGKIDGGLLVKLDPDALTAAVGGRVADGKPLESALKKLASVAENDPNFGGVDWNFAQYQGVRFHRLQAPVQDEKAQKLLGEKLTVVVGIGPKSAYVALGKNSLETLKAVIDKSKADPGKQVPPVKLVVSVGDILKFAAAQENDPKLARAAKVAQGEDVKDNVVLTVSPIPNGFREHIVVQEGVLKAIGAVSNPAAQ